MGLKLPILVKALNDYQRRYQIRHGRERGAWTELAKKAGLSSSNIGRIARGEITTTIETWSALHRADPENIPPVEADDVAFTGNASVDSDSEAFRQIPPLKRIPVFDCGAGEPSEWTDGDHPVGEADEFIFSTSTDKNAFAARIHGDSMVPALYEGDIVVMEPHRPVENGQYCFAALPDGRRLVKRYRRRDDLVILESLNPDYEPIYLDHVNGRGLRLYRVVEVIRKL